MSDTKPVAPARYVVTVRGPGIHYSVLVERPDDLELVRRVLNRIGKRFAEKAETPPAPKGQQ